MPKKSELVERMYTYQPANPTNPPPQSTSRPNLNHLKSRMSYLQHMKYNVSVYRSVLRVVNVGSDHCEEGVMSGPAKVYRVGRNVVCVIEMYMPCPIPTQVTTCKASELELNGTV